MNDVKKMTDWKKLQEKLDQKEESLNKTFSEQEIIEGLTQFVKGQDDVIKDIAKILRINLAKKNKNKPIANLLFLGPTGTGKTELAKAIARLFYDSSESLLRFDCSELGDGNMGKTRLVGSSAGYVGSEMGGQLTRPMFGNKRRVILFDEIEKAHPSVFDLFLQLMGEGRLTEQGSGKTADYTETIFIMTSNAHADKISEISQQVTDSYEKLNEIKSYLSDSKVFRPEIIGRVDKVAVFNPLKGIHIAEISLLKLKKLGEDYGLEVEFIDPASLLSVMEKNEKVSKFGIRELERILDNEFAEKMIQAKEKGLKKVRFDKDGNLVE